MPRTPLPPDELGERLAEVFDVFGPLYRRVQRVVEDAAPIEGVSVGVRAVLVMLTRDGPATVPQLARSQALSRQFVQRMVNDALDRGWVRLQTNPAHKRSSLVALTASGRRTITAVVRRENRAMRDVGGGLTGRDVDTCLAVLRQMHALFADVDVDRRAREDLVSTS